MITAEEFQHLAETHGTPLFVIDHDELRNARGLSLTFTSSSHHCNNSMLWLRL